MRQDGRCERGIPHGGEGMHRMGLECARAAAMFSHTVYKQVISILMKCSVCPGDVTKTDIVKIGKIKFNALCRKCQRHQPHDCS